MRRRFQLLCALCLLAGCASSGAGGSAAPRSASPAGASAEAPRATKETAVPKAMKLDFARAPFGKPQVAMAKSMPPQFHVMLDREMPTPGWRFDVDGIDVDEKARRIVARVSAIAPEGITAQVITDTRCRLDVGTLAQGRYVLELWARRGNSGEHVLEQAFVLDAR